MKYIICIILLVYTLGLRGNIFISHWGKYVYQDTLEFKGEKVFFDSELILFEKDSTYAYSINCHSINIRNHKVSSYGRVKLEGDLFYLIDTSSKNMDIEFDVYETPPKELCGVMLSALTEEEQLEMEGTHTNVSVLVPFNPSLTSHLGFNTQICIKINGQDDNTLKWTWSDLKYTPIPIPIFRIYDNIQVSFNEGMIDSMQICIKQDVVYSAFLKEGEHGKSIVNCSKGYRPFYKNRAVAYTIVLNTMPFIPYENVSYWQIHKDKKEIFIERSRGSEETLFIRLKKVL